MTYQVIRVFKNKVINKLYDYEDTNAYSFRKNKPKFNRFIQKICFYILDKLKAYDVKTCNTSEVMHIEIDEDVLVKKILNLYSHIIYQKHYDNKHKYTLYIGPEEMNNDNFCNLLTPVPFNIRKEIVIPGTSHYTWLDFNVYIIPYMSGFLLV